MTDKEKLIQALEVLIENNEWYMSKPTLQEPTNGTFTTNPCCDCDECEETYAYSGTQNDTDLSIDLDKLIDLDTLDFGEGVDSYTLVHTDADGTTSTRSFENKVFIEEVVKEFTYFLQGIGFSETTIEKYIPYFDL